MDPITDQEIYEALARLIIAWAAWKEGEIRFAEEVLAGAWDHNNRADIKAVLEKLQSSSTGKAMLALFRETSNG